jgi:hypothetical protein
MPEQVTISVFLIRRLNISLWVVLRSTGLVKIEPYQCKEENQRLWSVIAKTQTVLAQTQLEQNRGQQSQLSVLCTLFQQHGWEVKKMEERKELSL